MDNNEDGPSILCQLILAQLVYEKGENSFDEVSRLLRNHSLLKSEKHVPQTPGQCETLYSNLLEEKGLKRDENDTKKTPTWVNKLAQSLYMSYSDQLMHLIKQDEEEFKKTFHDLEELKNNTNNNNGNS